MNNIVFNDNPTNLKESNDNDYTYKAKKYHYKCQHLIKQMMANGAKCPIGYEHYLEPFKEKTT